MGGMVPVDFRYASNSTRPVEISVNGGSPVNAVFTSSGGWSDWSILRVDLPLEPGLNTVRILASTSARGPNMDKMEVYATPLVYAAGEVGPGQTAAEAFDGDSNTAWKHYSPHGSWLQRAFPFPLEVTGYTLTSSQGAQANDPRDWTLQGSNDYGATWTTLDTRSAVTFSSRGESQTFSIAHSGSYKLYRLNITAVQNLSNADSVQLAQLIFSFGDVPPVSPDPTAFSVAPHPVGTDAISMTAQTGFSILMHPVEY